MFLGPNDEINQDELHENIPPQTDTEICMTYLAHQLLLDTQGGIKGILAMRDAIPIPVLCFAKHDKYGAEGMKLQYQYRAARLPRMLASTLSDL